MTILARLKADLSITGTTSDAFIVARASIVVAAIEAVAGIAIYPARTVEETFEIDPADMIGWNVATIMPVRLSQPPTTVTSVVRGGRTLTGITVDAEAAVRETGTMLRIAREPTVVTYTAGTDNADQIMPIHWSAITDLVERALAARGRDPTLKKASVIDVGSFETESVPGGSGHPILGDWETLVGRPLLPHPWRRRRFL